MRRFSRRLSGGGEKTGDKRGKSQRTGPITLRENSVPEVTKMTTSNLFNSVAASAGQSTNMDRTLYEIPQPSNVDAMTDLIKDHEPGSLFPYIGVVGTEGEGSDARRARMLALKPSYNRRDIPKIVVSGCPLISREGDFTMNVLMSFAKQNTKPVVLGAGPLPAGAHNEDYSISKPYVHIRQITILFTPNVSSTSNYCNLWMNLIDNRLIDSDRGSQTNVVVSNQESIMEMSCDYCVSSADLHSFSLSYTLERDIVHPGFQWGTASFYFSITESDLPFQSSKIDSMGVYRMPITTLMKRETNADKSDISFTPADVVRMRELYQAGDIVDVDEPKTARLKTNTYSKSSIRSKPKGEKLDIEGREGWGFMKGAVKPKIEAMVASIDPDDDEVSLHDFDQEEINHQRKLALRRYAEEQEKERVKFVEHLDSEEEGVSMKETVQKANDDSAGEESSELSKLFKKQNKKINFGPSGV